MSRNELVRVRDARTPLVLGLVLALTAGARMPFWLSHTNAFAGGDAIIWEVWSRAIYEHGFINVFRTADSNNVGYHYVLWATSAIYGRISPEYELWTPAIRVLIKVPPFVCDLLLATMIFFFARSFATGRTVSRDAAGALAALAYALAPGVIYDSMWWGQIDAVITACMLAAVVLLARGNIALAWAIWTLGFLFKPQPIVILPVMVAFTYWRFGLPSLARGAAAGAAVFAGALAPFLLHGDAHRIVDTYQRMFEQWPLDLAQGAWNGWSILDARGNPMPSDAVFRLGGLSVDYELLSLALSAAATVIVLAYLRRNLDLPGLLLASAAMVFTFYMLPTSTHERYLFPLFALAAPLLVRDRWLVLPYAALTATFFLNLLAINPPNASDVWDWHGTNLAITVAVVHVALYLALTAWMLGVAVRGFALPRLGRAAATVRSRA